MASFEPIPVVTSSGGVLCDSRPPGENDVILGAGCNQHCGNLKFRQFIKAYKRARLQTKTKIETATAVKEVVQFWRKLTPPGRFLAKFKGSPDGHWNEVNEKQATRIASFFLFNQSGGELKRQKSIDAMRNNRNFQNAQQQQVQQGSGAGQDFFGQGNGMGNVGNQSQYQGMGNISGQGTGQCPDFMSSLEPMPIGPVGSSPTAWDGGESQQAQFSREPNFKGLEPDMGGYDFNPLPFKPNNSSNEDYGLDDFEPLPSNYKAPFQSCSQNAYSRNPFDVSTNAQFGGAQEQVQVSVNMVVNTMPQGYPRRDNAVNTVTNIQIGTGSMMDERNSNDGFVKSSFGDGFQGSNFQLTTDTSNGFIQISAQSNPNDGPSNMMTPQGMVSSGHRLSGFNNAGSMGNGGPYGANGNAPQGSMSNNFERRSINLSINNVGAQRESANNQNSALTWNKNEVANSVPDAASLVGSVFDDW